MAEEGASGVGGGQAEDEEVGPTFQEVMVAALENDLRLLQGGEYEVVHYEWGQDFGSREVGCGMIERFPLGIYHVKLSYRRKP